MHELKDDAKILVDMYADIQVIKEKVEDLEEKYDIIINIEKDIHAVKVSARLIKWMAALVGAVAGIASNYIKNLIGGGNG